MPQRQHRRTQAYKTRKIIHNKTTIKLQNAAKDAANACVTALYTIVGL